MIFVNAVGVMNALGSNPEEIRNRLLTGESPGMRTSTAWLNSGQATVVGEIIDPLRPLPAEIARYDCRNNRLILAVLGQIGEQVERAVKKYGAGRVGVVMGTSTSGIAAGEEALKFYQSHHALPQEYHYVQQEIGAPAEFLAGHLGLMGPAFTISTACSSSARAFISAWYLLETNVCDAVLAGGADTLCRLTVNGFNGLESIARGVCNPLSVNRDGINVGEGAALFLLSREKDAVALLGAGESSDAYHVSAPDPAGRGAAAAMRNALTRAGLSADNIGYINLHGTATRLNDLMESKAVAEVFGHEVPCSSTKPLTGHTLGAAGAIEAAFCWLVLTQSEEARIPPHLWDGMADPELARIRIAACDERLGSPICLSNSFAFGGNNVSLIFGRTTSIATRT